MHLKTRYKKQESHPKSVSCKFTVPKVKLSMCFPCNGAALVNEMSEAGKRANALHLLPHKYEMR